jgi:multiple sugar transport system substrate-binding protein
MKNGNVSRRDFLKLAGAASAAGILAACAPATPAPTQPAAPAATQAPATQASVATAAPAATATVAPTQAPVTITYGRHDTGAGVNATIKSFQADHPNITVKMNVIDNFHDHIYALAAAGSLPDVVRSWEAMVLELGRHAIFVDVQPYIDATSDFHPEDFYANWWGYPVSNGKRFGIPDASAPHVTFYNMDMFDKAGIPYPDPKWTWDDFSATAYKLTDVAKGVWGSQSIPVGWQYYIEKFCWQNGGDFFSPDYATCTIGEQAAIDAHQIWADFQLSNKGAPAPSQIASIGGENVAGNLMAAGKAAMFRMGCWITGQLVTSKIKFNIAPEPQKVRQDTITHGAFNAIPATTKNKDVAWMWVDATTSTQGIYNYCIDPAALFPGTRKSTNLLKPAPWIATNVDWNVNWDVIPDCQNYGHVLPGPNHEGEALKIIGDAQQAIFTGSAKAKDILPTIAPQVDNVLATL